MKYESFLTVVTTIIFYFFNAGLVLFFLLRVIVTVCFVNIRNFNNGSLDLRQIVHDWP